MNDPSRKIPIAHLLLAAGASTRMGRPKQLLAWNDTTLIRHAVNIILQASIAQRLVVILGAKRELILPELKDLPVDIVVNPDWDQGMGSTIRTGLTHLLEKHEAKWEGICISLTDQPLITAQHLRSLYELWEQAAHRIVAAQYDGILGVPAIFAKDFFPDLLALQGAAGARKILMQAGSEVIPMDLPEARFDLDTPEDYERLRGDRG